ncbi:hypothetical protein [Roseovarius sp.]|uniref:hypothetical protein n=1 Tax=Roseovarius sp. TaxID=1486281 RepID=UPI003D09C388
MAIKPILFSAPMIRALLAGRKTQTRRLLKKPTWGQAEGWPERIMYEQDLDGRLQWFARETGCLSDLPIPQPGDLLWVREAWRACKQLDGMKPSQISQHEPRRMEADGAMIEPTCMMVQPGRYRHARFMPIWASRLTLRVTDVRVQRLQEISEADAQAEGVQVSYGAPFDPENTVTDRRRFNLLWDSLNADRAPWDDNPWVAAYTFEVQQCNVDQMEAA